MKTFLSALLLMLSPSLSLGSPTTTLSKEKVSDIQTMLDIEYALSHYLHLGPNEPVGVKLAYVTVSSKKTATSGESYSYEVFADFVSYALDDDFGTVESDPYLSKACRFKILIDSIYAIPRIESDLICESLNVPPGQ